MQCCLPEDPNAEGEKTSYARHRQHIFLPQGQEISHPLGRIMRGQRREHNERYGDEYLFDRHDDEIGGSEFAHFLDRKKRSYEPVIAQSAELKHKSGCERPSRVLPMLSPIVGLQFVKTLFRVAECKVSSEGRPRDDPSQRQHQECRETVEYVRLRHQPKPACNREEEYQGGFGGECCLTLNIEGAAQE